MDKLKDDPKRIVHTRLCQLYGSATSIAAASIVNALAEAGYLGGAPVDGEAAEDWDALGEFMKRAGLFGSEKVRNHIRERAELAFARLRSTPKPEGDGEAGDLEEVAKIVAEAVHSCGRLVAWRHLSETTKGRFLKYADRIRARLRPAPKQGMPEKWYCANCREFVPAQIQLGDLICVGGCGNIIASCEVEAGEGGSAASNTEGGGR